MLDGRYRIIQLLGHGGMGKVYLAEETRLRRRCAIKVLHLQLAEDRTHVERFLREAQTIAQFEHPNIVDIYAYGEEPTGIVWFAMELLTGEDLDARLKARADRPFSTHECCLWAIQIARAVAVVHQSGLIHRDLKTSNVFLAHRRDGEEIVKILDFGIARPEEGSELTATGISLGTPSYMSPEQVLNTVVDRRSDIYSFGVLLYKLLTGRMPFLGEPIQVAMGHCLSPVPVPSVVASEQDISPELDAVLLRTMAKEPGDRYQTMAEIEAILTAILQAEAPDLAPQARPARMVTHSPVGRRREDATPLAPVTMPPVVPVDDAGTAPTAHVTGATAEIAVAGPTGGNKWLGITTAASFLGVAILLAVAIAGGRYDAAPAAADPAAARVAQTIAPRLPPPNDPPAPAPAPAPTPVSTPSPPTTPDVPAVVDPQPGPTEAPAPSRTPTVTPTLSPTSSGPIEPDPGDDAVAPVKPKPKPVAAPVYPRKQVERKALACRRKQKLVDGPKITIDYAVGVDGKVTRAIPSVKDELGICLAAALQATQFEPGVVLGRKVAL